MADPAPEGVYRISAILTSAGDGAMESFSTLDEMPAVMRARCVRALDSSDTATVLIADAGGRRFLERQAVRPPQAQPAPGAHRFPWRLAAEIIFVGAAGLALWALATLR